MTPPDDLALDQEALLKVLSAECNDNEYGEPCLCERDGALTDECRTRWKWHEGFLRASLRAIRYPAQRAVVEAAREWVAAKTPDQSVEKYRRISAALAALDAPTDD